MAEKNRYWCAVMYPENMIDNWEEEIAMKLQKPFAYCIHDKCKDSNGDVRKTHVHIMIVWGNTTTYNSALNLFKKLEKENCVAVNKVEVVHGVRLMYDYLIHDTDNAKKKNKYLYDPGERITGNGFDIGSYEQLSIEEQEKMLDEIFSIIEDNQYTNFFDLAKHINSLENNEMTKVFRKNQSYFNNVVKGLYHKTKENQ